MQNTDNMLPLRFFDLKRKLQVLNNEKRKLRSKILATKKSIEELYRMDTKVVYQKIDEILIKRQRQVVIDDTKEELATLDGELKAIEENLEIEMTVFKQMALKKG